ncbi:hypothetical protein BUY36_07870, partial [Staphylococcus cohnii]
KRYQQHVNKEPDIED